MNIAPISFAGTYKVGIGEKSTRLDVEKYFDLLNRCDDSGIKNEQETKLYISKTTGDKVFEETTTIYAPDSHDKKIEDYCKLMGINFTRVNKTEE